MLHGYDSTEAICGDLIEENRKLKEEIEALKWIDVNETFIAEEAIYIMPYHELDDIRAFVRNHEWEDIPESIKEHLEKWEEFLIENL